MTFRIGEVVTEFAGSRDRGPGDPEDRRVASPRPTADEEERLIERVCALVIERLRREWSD